jgi:hypothetical protein
MPSSPPRLATDDSDLSPFEQMRRRLMKPQPPGLTAHEKKQARDKRQREIKAEVLELDPLCVVCEQRPSFDPHHIVFKSKVPKKADYLLNECGICRVCHDKIHKLRTLKITGSRVALTIWEWVAALGRHVAREPTVLPMPGDEHADRSSSAHAD